MIYLAVFCGGGLGSLVRMMIGLWLAPLSDRSLFPWGTLTVNLTGAFLIGFLATAMTLVWDLPVLWRYGLITGFLGGFTTFSAFSLESLQLLQRGAYGPAAFYIGTSVIGTIALAFLGHHLAKVIS